MPPASTNPRGFTLIEVMAVLVLLTLCTAAVTLSLAPAADRARWTDALDRLRQFDVTARHVAQRSGQPLALNFDLGTQTMRAVRADDAAGMDATDGPAPRHMPTGFRLAGVRTAQDDVAFGRLTIDCSSQGRTPTYAVGIESEATHEQIWAVMPGLAAAAGPLEVIRDRWALDEIFDRLAGHDPR